MCPGANQCLWRNCGTDDDSCGGVVRRMRPLGKVSVLILKVVKWMDGQEVGDVLQVGTI